MIKFSDVSVDSFHLEPANERKCDEFRTELSNHCMYLKAGGVSYAYCTLTLLSHNAIPHYQQNIVSDRQTLDFETFDAKCYSVMNKLNAEQIYGSSTSIDLFCIFLRGKSSAKVQLMNLVTIGGAGALDFWWH
jgi:hypothetical protein